MTAANLAEHATVLNPADDVLMTSAQLQRRWGSCSAMFIWRRLRDDLDMPRPLLMRGRRYWYLSHIVQYEAKLMARSTNGGGGNGAKP
jgi:hypothetical protein